MAYVQVYTGNGKGKTTAALGLLLRAAGAGLSVRMFQFMKKGKYAEITALHEKFPQIEVTQLGTGRFIDPKNIPEEELQKAGEGFRLAREAVLSGAYDLVVLDEINGAMSLQLISPADVLALIRSLPERTEMVLTGRDCPEDIIQAADLCTEMRPIKHYYDKGVMARKGIEN